MNRETVQSFRPDAEGIFVDRPNRFVVRVTLGAEVASAHCPNPGRLSELLFPGSRILLERGPEGRKLPFTAVAVEHLHTGQIVPLASVRSNPTVGALVLPRWFPGANIRPEYPLEGSRFDFLVEHGDERHLIEVKACSEVESGSAMFPDAPSDRARKHLEELARWGRRGYRPHVVFAVVHGSPRYFCPNVHTDPEFARTLRALAPQLNLHAVLFQTSADGLTHVVSDQVPIELPDPGPDAGTLVRVMRWEGRWRVTAQWYPESLERAVAKSPARSTFALRGKRPPRDLGNTGHVIDKGVWEFYEDPRTRTEFLAILMRSRHQSEEAPHASHPHP